MTLKDYVNFKLTHADKTAEASGYPLVMENCKANKKMKQLEVYGNSVQDGTPTPEEPIEVQSVGELVTDATDVNYGKYKIPVVQRGKNLTDGIIEPVTTNIYLDEPLRKIGDYADYIDFANDKVVRVIKEHVLTGTEKVQFFSGGNENNPNCYTFLDIGSVGYVINDICLCNKLQHQSNFSYSREGINTFRVLNSTGNNAARIVFRIYIDGISVVKETPVKNLLSEMYTNNSPLTFYYGLSEPVEESIECELPKLKAKTSAVEVDTNISPSNMSGKYIKK